jgi:hypothetical protein
LTRIEERYDEQGCVGVVKTQIACGKSRGGRGAEIQSQRERRASSLHSTRTYFSGRRQEGRRVEEDRRVEEGRGG